MRVGVGAPLLFRLHSGRVDGGFERVLAMKMEPDESGDVNVEPDLVVLLWYFGWATFFRSAATGMKPWDRIGFDAKAFVAACGGGSSLVATWLLVGLVTGIFTRELRYQRPRVVFTWIIAAPAAQLLKTSLYGGFRWDNAIVDMAMTLVLMLGLRWGEERGDLPPP
jgi:hypothetical protein